VPPVQFNTEEFAKKTTAIKTLLKLQGKESPTISRLYVCICGDQKSDYGEELNSPLAKVGSRTRISAAVANTPKADSGVAAPHLTNLPCALRILCALSMRS